MTLVLTWADHDNIIHVADRRIGSIAAGKYEPRDDKASKIILAGGTLIVSFAGLAELERHRSTSNWIMDQLALEWNPNTELGAVLQKIADKLTNLTQRRRRFRNQALRITLCGWALSDTDEVTLIAGIVTNLDSHNSIMTSFKGIAHEFPHRGGWWENGAVLPPDIRNEMIRLLRRGKRKGIGPVAIADILLHAIRRTHRRNKTVGPTALVGILPHAEVERGRRIGTINIFTTTDGSASISRAMLIGVPADVKRLTAVPSHLSSYRVS
ncbi:hypothetical protein [Amycolatopsis sp. NBC_01286]|uniref:hypothetical protein n=1 Tax=Amycolatopsis sp. NBC_01286 TaxID=2903560 RepID=UPI002E102B0C|nr:hypothetical protein OG570_16920 [Amycolatopsis sp. NBC_01286]